jgi:transcriptional regulator with XRE-family HTH domain
LGFLLDLRVELFEQILPDVADFETEAKVWRVQFDHSRINQYERGVHTPDHATACKLARVLRVPTAFLYSDDDRIAELLLAVEHLTAHQVRQLAKRLAAQGS